MSKEKIEQFVASKPEWNSELDFLRKLLAKTELEEAYKWNFPVYTLDGKNVLGIGAFKNYIGIWFFQGFFLKDEKEKLVNAQVGKTKAMRQWRFSNLEELEENSALLQEYVAEAIQNEKDEKQIKPVRNTDPIVTPAELKMVLKGNKKLSDAFDLLTFGKRREYCEFIAEAKRERTKSRRIERIIPLILDGKGLHDKYKTIL